MKTTTVLPWFWGFWNPQNHPNEGVKRVWRQKEPILKKGKPNKLFCKVMRALQRSLSEAQKHNLTLIVNSLKELIKIHKQQCHLCKQKGS